MAPPNAHLTRRGMGSGRPYRNANTNAGVNRNRPAASRDAPRARGLHRRAAHVERARPLANAPTGPILASRMTYNDNRGRGGVARGGTARLQPQNGRRLQGRITTADDDGAGVATGGGERATRDPKVNHRARKPDTRAASALAPLPTSIDSDVDINIDTDTDTDIDIDINNITFENSQFTTGSGFSQASAMFCGSQPTQLADDSVPLSRPSGTVRTAETARPIRMVNEPTGLALNVDNKEGKHTPKHPVNTYRGKDPIKKLVQNKRLQAVLAGKPVPKERKKHKDERMELRIGGNTVMK